MTVYQFGIRYISRYKKRFFFVTISLFIASILELVSLAALLPVLNSLIHGSIGQEGVSQKILTPLGIENASTDILLSVIVLFMLLRTVLIYVSSVITGTMSVQLEKDLRQTMFTSLLSCEWRFFSGKRPGTISNLMLSEANKAGLGAAAFSKFIVYFFLTTIFTAAAFLVSPAAFSVMVLISIPLIILASYLQKKTREVSLARITEANFFNSKALEYLNHIKFTKASHNESFERQRFQHNVDKLAGLQSKAVTYQSLVGVLPDAIIVVMIAALISVILFLEITALEDFIYFLLISFRAQRFLGQTQINLQKVSSFIPSYQKCLEVIDEAATFKEDPEFSNFPSPQLQEKIELKDVCFSYGDNTILRGINLQIPKNKTVALVGPSGSGKTTIADLIVGLFQPQKGQILIDQADLWTSNIFAWRDKVAYVPQDPAIFHGSIKENICWNLKDYDPSHLEKVLQLTGVTTISHIAENGIDAVIHDRGENLSGGQKQRVAIARALMKKPEVLIMDEATSALDHLAEEQIKATLNRLQGTLTIIIIAHRFTTVRDADKVVIIKEGKIVEEGRFEDLTKGDSFLLNQ